MIFRARFVVPVEGPPIEHGAIGVKDGRITAVDHSPELSGGDEMDFGDAVICPAFVNAHTHLELSNLAGRTAPSPDFVEWLGRLVASVREMGTNRDSVQQSVERGIIESVRSGITTVGDITRWPRWTRPSLGRSVLRAVSFGEVIAIGSCRDGLRERLEDAFETVASSARLHVGISPHSPYTVEPDAMRTCAEEAASRSLPICVHVAETREEERFARTRSGPLAEHLQRVGVWDEAIPTAGCSPVALVREAGLITPRTILAHVNYVCDADLASIRAGGASVVFCPRTHAAFAHEPHRFRDMLAAGVNVCIGTDSLASNPSLSILDELRFLRRHAGDVDPSILLAMGTLNGAKALGLEAVCGSLRVGKDADFVVIRLDESGHPPAWEEMFDGAADPSAVYARGVCLAAR